jgi:hypothetical protein
MKNLVLSVKEKQMLRSAQHDRYGYFHAYWWAEGPCRIQHDMCPF